MTASGKYRPMGARELALLLVTKLALAWLPNIEPVSLLVLVYMRYWAGRPWPPSMSM